MTSSPSASPEIEMFELFHEIKHFSTKLKEYNHKYIDADIVRELINSINVINELLEDPIMVHYNGDNKDVYKAIAVNSDLIYRCQVCKSDIGPYKRMREHLTTARHLKECKIVANNTAPQLPNAKAVTTDADKKRSASLGGSMKNLTLSEQHGAVSKKTDGLSQSTLSLREHIFSSSPLSVDAKHKISVVKATSVKTEKKAAAPPAPAQIAKGPAAVQKKIEKKEKKVEKIGLNKALKKLMEGDIHGITKEQVETGRNLKFSKAYENIVKDLNNLLKVQFPAVKSYCFGSRINGLGTKKGDLDIFVDIGNTYQHQTKLSKQKMGELVDLVMVALAKQRNVWDDFEKIKAARTPILRVFNHKEKIDCDISFSSGLSHCNTYLLQYFLTLQPVCHKLAAFIKEWSVKSQLNISSYVFTLLVIFYLQNLKILPSVHELQSETEPFEIGFWQANFDNKSLEQLKIKENDDFAHHLHGFFNFYGNLYLAEEFVVCPLLGHGIKKSLFVHGQESQLPSQFDRYKRYMASINLKSADKIDDLFAYDKPLVIQDPYELIHNVSKGVTVSNLQRLRQYCKQSAEILKTRNFK